MKIAAVQIPASRCYDGSAIDHLRTRVRECEHAGVTLLCCPEGAIGGLADYVDAPASIAVPAGSDSIVRLLEPLSSNTVTVVIGFTERDKGGRYYNSAAVYSQEKVCGIYRKRHPAIRRSRYSAGMDAPVFVIPGATLGVLICRDSADSSLATAFVEQGAQILCVPTNNAMPLHRGGPGLVEEIRRLDAQYATTFGVDVVRADVTGAYRNLVSAGASMVTTADGRQLCATGMAAGELIVCDVSDLSSPTVRVDIAAAAV